MLNDTITDNAALDGPGSGPRQLPPGGAVTNAGIMMIRNVTVARNRVLGFHDWHYHAGGIVTMPHGYSALSNSIVSDNAADLPAISPDCFGTSPRRLQPGPHGDELLHRRERDGQRARRIGSPPALADNGGPTMTSLPPADNPAVDAANPAAPNADDATTCSPFDQRGIARPRDGNADGISRCAWRRRTLSSSRIVKPRNKMGRHDNASSSAHDCELGRDRRSGDCGDWGVRTRRDAAGTTITVTTTADDNTTNGNCSRREALAAANTDTTVDASRR